ncbi:hypothetical protein [Brevifollis gellanilyticus]|uniref:Uncharacterized protein n=1 Tax=Brevifollis gellanilyticus TaxID=748831 RepID=A0A512MI39_9BACT|nr:hypothetical protein [Brevifollis gellanilyticus]GEP46404.1 hypothetical protein BGE01nite_56950 [Brevifollis gellanilyticus]
MKTLLLFLLFCSPAMARIGETRAQCEARYGPAVSVRSEGETTVHARAGFKVECSYFEGKCDCILFSKMPASPGLEDLPLTEAEQKTLMEANSGGKSWTQKAEKPEIRMKLWQCDGLLAAYDGGDHNLRVTTGAYAARLDAKWEADQAAKDKNGSKGNLQDF